MYLLGVTIQGRNLTSCSAHLFPWRSLRRSYRCCLGILAFLWMFTTLLASRIPLLIIFHGGLKARSCDLVFHWMIVFGFHGKCFGVSNLMFASGLNRTGFFGNLNLLLSLDCKAVRRRSHFSGWVQCLASALLTCGGSYFLEVCVRHLQLELASFAFNLISDLCCPPPLVKKKGTCARVLQMSVLVCWCLEIGVG